MKRALIFIGILFICAFINTSVAQRWNYYNPTIWYDLNTIEIPGTGVIAIGGGHEAHDSTQIMFQSHDYGHTWNENAHDGLKPWIKSIAFSDSIHGYAVGYEGRIIRSDDAGAAWGHDTLIVNRSLNKIFYAGSGTYYVAGGNKTNDSMQTIIKSTNYGHSWSVIRDTYGPWLQSIYFTDTLRGFAIGVNGVILTTSNGGSSWLPVISPVQRDFNAITIMKNGIGYIVGGDSITPSHRTILRTDDNGLTWSVLLDSPGAILKDISFYDTQTGYIVGDSATILKTINGGLSWAPTIIDTSLTGNECFNAVKLYDRNFGAIGGKKGELYVYTDIRAEAYTVGSEQSGTTDATLSGAINTHTKKVKYSFYYSKNIMLSPNETQVTMIRNDTLIFISEHLQGLIPNTTYYYWIKATTPTDTVYGDTLSFFTGNNPSFIFKTLDATSVLNFSANLNGYVTKCSEAADLFFEYGPGLLFDSLTVAIPATISDTLPHSVQTTINGLTPNTHYFFRLKGITASGSFLGDTKMFYTAGLPNANTQVATNITETSGTLNGSVNNQGFEASIKFEFGLTPLYGAVVNAFPDSAIATGNVSATYTISGLTPGNVYHYRIKSHNIFGTSLGEDMTFVAGGPSALADLPTNVKANSAQLNGLVNANNATAVNKFEWGLTRSYGHEATANPVSSTGNSNIVISSLITGLTANTIYHYRVKATNTRGTNYSDDMMFVTVIPPIVTALPASDISTVSATLNGTADAGGVPTGVFFEYGTSTAYGNDIVAIPDSASSIGDVAVKAMATGLLPNTTYHYRLKGTNNDTTKYSDDEFFYTGESEIPNFDFESWAPFTYSKPTGYDMTFGKISQTTDACNGNYAIKIKNDSIALTSGGQPGAILIGFTYDQGLSLTGGIPFNARPDSIKGCFKYEIGGGDSAIILMVLKKQGIPISSHIYGIPGSSGGVFKEIKFAIPYTSAGNADTLILGIGATNIYHMPAHLPNSYIIADNINFTGTSLNIPNNSFENWNINTFYALDGWSYVQKYVVDPFHNESFAVNRTTDADHGNYAVLLQNYIYPNDTLRGYLTINSDLTKPGFAVNARHKTFTGYYKFFPNNNDTMSIRITMFKNHNEVGSGNLENSSEVANYTPFITNITYINDTVIPDSSQILLTTITRGKPHGNSKLYVDNLNFDGFIAGIKAPVVTDVGSTSFNVYPNPFCEQAILSFTIKQDENVLVRLFDLSGKQVATLGSGRYSSGNHKIILSSEGLKKGFYVCVINTDKEVLNKKIVVY